MDDIDINLIMEGEKVDGKIYNLLRSIHYIENTEKFEKIIRVINKELITLKKEVKELEEARTRKFKLPKSWKIEDYPSVKKERLKNMSKSMRDFHNE